MEGEDKNPEVPNDVEDVKEDAGMDVEYKLVEVKKLYDSNFKPTTKEVIDNTMNKIQDFNYYNNENKIIPASLKDTAYDTVKRVFLIQRQKENSIIYDYCNKNVRVVEL